MMWMKQGKAIHGPISEVSKARNRHLLNIVDNHPILDSIFDISPSSSLSTDAHRELMDSPDNNNSEYTGMRIQYYC